MNVMGSIKKMQKTFKCEGGNKMESILATFGPLLVFVVLFYFLLIRPQQKRQKQVQQMQSDLNRGDKIITIGGCHGIIDAIDDKTIVIKTTDGSKITFDRSSVREVVSE